MLTQSEMIVVIVLDETISQGNMDILTAMNIPKSFDRVLVIIKCHSDVALLEIIKVERGKPLE